MISNALLTLSILIGTSSNETVTADEVRYFDTNLIQIQARIEDRIGNSIQLGGFSERVAVSPEVKIPRRGTRERAPLVNLSMLRQPSGWEIVDAKISTSWDQTLSSHFERLSSKPTAQRYSICQFLLRESPTGSRGQLWRTLTTQWITDPIRWLQLGGDHLSSEEILTREIERKNLQALAMKAGLYFHQDRWFSRDQFFLVKKLAEIDGHVLDLDRARLKKLGENDLNRMLIQSKKNNVPGEIQAGTSRKTLLSLWGDPSQVTWVRWQNHMIEQWDYVTQVVRIIDGRICTITPKAE
ncbi:MAG: hypothetical protein VX764_05330 [Planctomycetota bacterium]|nr:hypothetical protein [Planctomycetota bacterium]